MKHMSPEARTLVDAARDADEPSREDAARVKQALVASIAAGAALTTSTSAAAASRGAALSGQGAAAVTSAKVLAWLGAGAAVGLVTAGVWVGITEPRSGAARPPAPAATVAPSPRLAASAAPPVALTPESAPTVPAAEEPETVLPEPPVAPASKTPRPKATAQSAAPRAPLGSSLGAETALLQAARAALGGGDARGALALLRQHAREYPNGALVEERLASEVFASCALGARANAARAAAELTRRAPSSPLRARVLDSCAGEK